jgi:Xaa-Pro aminopeptidase
MLMQRHAIDAWVLVAREYNEDPVVSTMMPATWLSARRRTILVFTDQGAARSAVSRYAVGDRFPAVWDREAEPDQWRALAGLLERSDPAQIALNTSQTYALADGLSHTEHEALVAALPQRLRSRIVSAEPLAIGWLETRIPSEVTALAEACAIAHDIVRRGLSREAVTPGVTSTRDLEWWLRQTVHDAGFATWFHPAASVQRRGGAERTGFASRPGDDVIQTGDLVHVDFGIVHRGMHTDQQQHAYVLAPGETSTPAGLLAGVRDANRAQDLLMAEMIVGRTGNEILRATRAACADAGLDATIYTHAIGVHGHAAGPTIGLWDQQGGVPGAGDDPIHPETAYSIELSVAATVPEWGGQVVRFMLEEDALHDGTTVRFLDGRQTEPWVID